MLNQEIHTRNVTEIMIRIQDCTSKKIPEDDVDVQRARAKVAMLGIGHKKPYRIKIILYIVIMLFQKRILCTQFDTYVFFLLKQRQCNY